MRDWITAEPCETEKGLLLQCHRCGAKASVVGAAGATLVADMMAMAQTFANQHGKCKEGQ